MDQEGRPESHQDYLNLYVEWTNPLGQIRYQPRRLDDARKWIVPYYRGDSITWQSYGPADSKPCLYRFKLLAAWMARRSFRQVEKAAWRALSVDWHEKTS